MKKPKSKPTTWTTADIRNAWKKAHVPLQKFQLFGWYGGRVTVKFKDELKRIAARRRKRKK